MKHRLQTRLQVATDNFLGDTVRNRCDTAGIMHLIQFALGMVDEDGLS